MFPSDGNSPEETEFSHAWVQTHFATEPKNHPHEPSATNAQTVRSVSGASFQYTEAFPGELSELPGDQVDRYAVRNFLDQDLPVSSVYMDDAQIILDPNLKVDENFPYYWNHTSDLDDSYDVPMTALPAPSILDVSGNVFSAPALTPSQPNVSISDIAPGATQPSGTNRLTCPMGCRGTFGRPSEYRRHMTKHQGRSFRCTQPGCSKSFHRKDKLHDHLRQAHKITHPGRAHAAAATGVLNAAPTGGSGQM